jgi:hypothetical protein
MDGSSTVFEPVEVVVVFFEDEQAAIDPKMATVKSKSL